MKRICFILSLILIISLLFSCVSTTAAAEELSSHDLIEALSNREFNFSSGAGAWGTNLYIGSDGYFFGVYHDSDMGLSGDGFPNGTLFYCPFEGKFSFPESIPAEATSVQLSLETIHYYGIERYGENAESYGEEIRDGVRLVYSGPYGLEGSDTFTLYFPEQIRDNTSEEFLSWVRRPGVETSEYREGQLGCFALCNDRNQQGFSSYGVSATRSQVLKYIIATSIEVYHQNADIGNTQAEMNAASETSYKIWDDALNTIWAALNNSLNPESMQALTEDEMKWIDWKDASSVKAASEFWGGSLYPFAYYSALADRTRWRCYDLAEYFYF